MQLSFTPEEIIAIVQPKEIRGGFPGPITGISALEKAIKGDLSFLSTAKYREKVAVTGASVILLPADFAGEPVAGQCFLLVEHPSLALAKVCARIEQGLWPKPPAGVHPTAVIAASAKVAATAHVGPFCVIEEDAVVGEGTHLQSQISIGRSTVIGKDCWFMAGVVVAAHCVVGDRVRLQPGAVIGADGFGYEFVAGRHEKVPQVGMVEIGNDVEIGANSTVDRARFSRTVIGEGTKIDNLVQIGHNVIVGKHCILCSQVGVSGSTTIEDYVVLAGQVGVAGHITIGKGAKVGGQSGIQADIAPNTYMNGSPARPFMLDRRLYVLQERLPEFFKRLQALEEK